MLTLPEMFCALQESRFSAENPSPRLRRIEVKANS